MVLIGFVRIRMRSMFITGYFVLFPLFHSQPSRIFSWHPLQARCCQWTSNYLGSPSRDLFSIVPVETYLLHLSYWILSFSSRSHLPRSYPMIRKTNDVTVLYMSTPRVVVVQVATRRHSLKAASTCHLHWNNCLHTVLGLAGRTRCSLSLVPPHTRRRYTRVSVINACPREFSRCRGKTPILDNVNIEQHHARHSRAIQRLRTSLVSQTFIPYPQQLFK